MKIAAYLISALVGYALGHYLLDDPAAAYASTLVSYHLFLAYLIFIAEHKGFSMPIGPAIVTHLAFLALLIGLPYMRAHLPFFGLLSLLVPGMAPFEAKWLFGGDSKIAEKDGDREEVKMRAASAADHEAFRAYLALPDRTFRRPGQTLNEEFNLWLSDRITKRSQPKS